MNVIYICTTCIYPFVGKKPEKSLVEISAKPELSAWSVDFGQSCYKHNAKPSFCSMLQNLPLNLSCNGQERVTGLLGKSHELLCQLLQRNLRNLLTTVVSRILAL